MTRAIIALLALTLPAVSAHATVAWQGEIIIDTATAACTSVAGIGKESVIKSVLQPKNLSGNTSNTIVSFVFNQLGMFALVLDHGAMPNGTGAAFGNNVSGVLKANVGVKYTQFVQKPASIATNTPTATLKGRIQDFMFIPNCDVAFRGAYTKNTN